jgi:hypothetical protein
MATSWVVTVASERAELDASGGGEITFTVTNQGPVQDRAVFEVVPGEAADRSWFTVEEPQRLLSPGVSASYLVKIAVPAGTPAGTYALQGRVYSADTAPEESSAASGRVVLAVAGTATEPRPWWLLAVAALVVVVIAVVGWLIFGRGDGPPNGGQPAPVRIDFESPPLGADQSRAISPYVAGGVTFTAESAVAGAVVGPVKNRFTSACAEPANDDQKLGTGTAESNIGRAGFPIRATFDQPLRPADGTVSVSVSFQTLAGSTVQLRLFDADGNLLAEGSATANPPAGTCDFPGGPRARTTLTVQSSSEVASAVISEATGGGRVFVIDDFVFTAAR